MSSAKLPRVLSASDAIYRMLLFVYPAAHRREYGPFMAQAFRDLCRDAYRQRGIFGLTILWIRTLVDMAATATVEHVDALKGGGWVMMQHRSVSPAPWEKVGLAILPGLFAIGTSWDPGTRGLIPITGLGLCVLLSIAGFARERRFPIWGFATLGILFSFLVGGWWLLWGPLGLLAVVIGLIRYQRRGVHVPRLVWVLLGLMILASMFTSCWWSLAAAGVMLSVVVIGLPLAKRSGLLASLFVAGAGFILWEATLDLAYGLWKTPWGIVMVGILAVLLLVVSPLWVLRARSTRGQVWGLLLPAFIALAGVAVINATVRADPAILERVVNFRAMYPGDPLVYGISGGTRGAENLGSLLITNGLAATQLFMGMVVAVVLYHWIERQDPSVGPPAPVPDSLSDVVKVGF